MPLKFFITHSWKDIDFAERLCGDLRASGLDGFLDAHSMRPGDSIPSRIERGLKDCDVYIPVFSPDALESDWCDWEIDMAITMNRTRKGRPRIIPVIAKSCSVPDRLIHLLYVNFVGQYDDALNELLTKGLGLQRVAVTPSQDDSAGARPEGARNSPQMQPKNRVILVGIFVVLAVVLTLLSAIFFASQLTPGPQTQVAFVPTETTKPISVETVEPVVIVVTATPLPPTSTPTATPTPRSGEEHVIGGAPMVFVPAAPVTT